MRTNKSINGNEGIAVSPWTNFVFLGIPFDPENICMHKGCEEKCVARIAVLEVGEAGDKRIINYPGVISAEYDVCAKHKEEFHGKRVPFFPLRTDFTSPKKK